MRRRISAALDRFFRNPWVELLVGALIIVSIVLTLVEFLLAAGAGTRGNLSLARVQLINEWTNFKALLPYHQFSALPEN